MQLVKRFMSEIILIFIWFFLLALPHFQKTPTVILLSLGLFLFAYLYWLTSKSFMLSAFSINRRIYATTILLILISLVLTMFEISTPYLLFSRLGSYSMFLNGNLVVFGDLIHLTSAATCIHPIEVGSILCDPWNRTFNQNPDVVYILKFLSIHTLFAFGVGSFLIVSFSFYLILKKFSPSSPLVWLMCLTPPMILAIDRGNETIAVGLIALSLYIWSRNPLNSYFILPLFFAGIFKIWPLFLLVLLVVLDNRKNLFRIFVPLILVAPYLFIRFSDFRHISSFTQQGSRLGGSFGWPLLSNLDQYSQFAILSSIICTFVLFKKTSLLKLSESNQFRDNPWILSLMLSYIFIFFSGSHFTYRLIMLVPLAIVINGIEGSRPMQVLIFLILLTSRLSVVIISTSSLIFVFAFLIFNGFRDKKNRC